MDRQIYRYTDRQTDKQTGRRDRQKDKQTTNEREREERENSICFEGVHHILFIYKLYQLRDITAIID